MAPDERVPANYVHNAREALSEEVEKTAKINSPMFNPFGCHKMPFSMDIRSIESNTKKEERSERGFFEIFS